MHVILIYFPGKHPVRAVATPASNIVLIKQEGEGRLFVGDSWLAKQDGGILITGLPFGITRLIVFNKTHKRSFF